MPASKWSHIVACIWFVSLLGVTLVRADASGGAFRAERRAPPDQWNSETSPSLTGDFWLGKPVELNLTDPLEAKLADLVGRNGPDMRPSRDYKDFADIPLNVSMRAWQLLHDHYQRLLAEQMQLMQPVIDDILDKSATSGKCRAAIDTTLDAVKQMRSWSVRLLNSWGHFPMSGIFEGTYGDVGAFHTCVNIRNIHQVDHAHYCSLTFRPVLPSIRAYELVVRKEPRELRDLFADPRAAKTGRNPTGAKRTNSTPPALGEETVRDAFTDILGHAQYHHYVYYKLGSCWPIGCTPVDVRRIVKTLARRHALMSGPVKCYSLFSDDYAEEFDPDEIAGRPPAAAAAAAAANDYELHYRPEVVELVGGGTSNGSASATNASQQATGKRRKLILSIWDKNEGIFIWKPHFYRAHWVAASIIGAASVFILAMTLIDLVCVRAPRLLRNLQLAARGLPLSEPSADSSADSSSGDEDGPPTDQQQQQKKRLPTLAFECQEAPVAGRIVVSSGACCGKRRLGATNRRKVQLVAEPKSLFWSVVDDCSILTNGRQFFRVSEGQMRNDILCLNGIRCITMIWIIMTHTMMYNDWSAFARTRYVEVALSSLMSQPFFNGSYLVDTFFLMSGLLSAFTAFKHSQGLRAKFNSFAYIFGRWLRLTPQIFFVSMMYIVLPSLSSGPHWFPIVGEYSENCQSNWWINVLHLQAFYKKWEMCNFVTWWISIDFFYHYFALIVIWIIMLAGHTLGFLSMGSIVLTGIAYQCYRHFELALPPNILSTIPQTGAMWTTMTLDFFWTPYTHVVPFFFGFYIGYLMALKRKLVLEHLNTRRALIGWTLSVSLLSLQSYSTYWWVVGEAGYSRLTSTVFYTLCQIVWAGSLCWIIVACHHDYGGLANRVLSWKAFIILGKASYLVYLSHFQVLFLNFGNQSLLLEPSVLMMIFQIVGNIFLSTLLGVVLCVVYELPWLKTHRRLMQYV